jgi:hypothetical protein
VAGGRIYNRSVAPCRHGSIRQITVSTCGISSSKLVDAEIELYLMGPRSFIWHWLSLKVGPMYMNSCLPSASDLDADGVLLNVGVDWLVILEKFYRS